MSNFKITHYFTYFLLISFSLLLFGCGSGDIDDLLGDEEQPATFDSAGKYSGNVVIEVLADSPKLSRQNFGRTSIVVQFVARDSNGFPLTSDQIDVEFLRDGREISREASLKSSASELQFNVNFGLVLDTSYSMVDSGAFNPMLNAASQSLQSGIDVWKKNTGDFNFYTTWFNDYIFSSVENTTPWTPEDIKSISAPASNQNSSTKLYAAVDYMVDKLDALPKVDKAAEAPADQNIILVFSDGNDEFSWYDNSNTPEEFGVIDNGAEYSKIGYKSIALIEDPENERPAFDYLIPNIEQSKNLTIHVIGLGDKIVESDLRKIAQTGHGTYRTNPDSEDLKNVFDRVIREFTTLQTHGVSMTIDKGEYAFTLRVRNKSGNKFADYSFNFETDEDGASVL